jgi:hypothetical protein
MLHTFTFIKKLSLALGVAGIGVLVGLPALAQLSPSSGEAPEFELSKEGYVILCNRTPLNSRCKGSPYYAGSSNQLPTENPAASPSGTTAPTQSLPSESPVPSSQDQAPGSMPNGSPSGSNGTMTAPSGTTAPTQNLPSESDTPSPQGQFPNGSTPPAVQSVPNSGTQDGGTPSPSGSNGNTTSPGGTTAPTQNLPSESPSK